MNKCHLGVPSTALFADVTKKLDPKSAINYSLASMVSASTFEPNTLSICGPTRDSIVHIKAA
jgi:hypothetical protein